MEYVLRTENLTKIYKKQTVVNNVSLCVGKGDIYGFVGKNGAGKTTFIRMILGLAKPDSGSFSLMPGESIYSARRKTGSLVEGPALYTNMTARENLRLLCTISGENTDQADDLLKLVGLDDTGKKKAGDFSLGMKQRLGIAMAMIGDPEFLILDEPINGLDPTGIAEIRELLLRLNRERGKTIFISSHILGELEKIATRYGIISRGKLVEELTAKELAEKCAAETIIRTDSPVKAADILRRFLSTDKVEVTSSNTLIISVRVDNIGRITNELFNNDIAVTGINTSDSGAERYFIKKMEEE